MTVTCVDDILMLFPVERSVFLREQASGLYRTSAFYFGRSFAEMPFHLVFACITATIFYWCVGLQNDAGKYFTFVSIVIMVNVVPCDTASLMIEVDHTHRSINAVVHRLGGPEHRAE